MVDRSQHSDSGDVLYADTQLVFKHKIRFVITTEGVIQER